MSDTMRPTSDVDDDDFESVTNDDDGGATDAAETLEGEGELVAVEKHPRAIRWMHWLNFPFLSIMVWSGLRIAWASDVRQPSFFNEDRFVPAEVWSLLDLDRALARGLAFHLSFGWFFAINGLLYFTYLVVTGEWRVIVPKLKALKNIPATLLHEMGIIKEAPEHGQYNVMQQLAYSTVLGMGVIILATGFALFKPTQLWWLVSFFGGYETARSIHFWTTLAFMAFFLVHVAQVARAGFSTFWAMVTGFELQRVPAEVANNEDS